MSKFNSAMFFLALCNLAIASAVPNPMIELEHSLSKELELIQFMSCNWKSVQSNSNEYDVVIIGAGMAGMAAAVALQKEGIKNIRLFDQSPEGYEGPWKTYAQMKMLRSKKTLVGPALDIPHLTFQAWYIAKFGQTEWDKFINSPREIWMDYLVWFRTVMNLPIENDVKLLSIHPVNQTLELNFIKQGIPFSIKSRKVVLATGRTGFGGPRVPSWVKDLPPSTYAHVANLYDYSPLKNKKVAIIGNGASAFDAACSSLENGAAKVDIIMRRMFIPKMADFSNFSKWIYHKGFYRMSDSWRFKMINAFFKTGIPPARKSYNQAIQDRNCSLQCCFIVQEASFIDSQLELKSTSGSNKYDFLILATGFHVDGFQQPELKSIMPDVLLWQDKISEELLQINPEFGHFPYLGPGFQFLSKNSHASYLNNIHCFNFGALMTHGVTNSEIPAISMAASRLAEEIAMDFFMQENSVVKISQLTIE